MYEVKIEDKKDIWIYNLADGNLLGRLVWRHEDETRQEFADWYANRLIERRNIVNSNILPSFLDDNFFAIE